MIEQNNCNEKIYNLFAKSVKEIVVESTKQIQSVIEGNRHYSDWEVQTDDCWSKHADRWTNSAWKEAFISLNKQVKSLTNKYKKMKELFHENEVKLTFLKGNKHGFDAQLIELKRMLKEKESENKLLSRKLTSFKSDLAKCRILMKSQGFDLKDFPSRNKSNLIVSNTLKQTIEESKRETSPVISEFPCKSIETIEECPQFTPKNIEDKNLESVWKYNSVGLFKV